jgi:hypothetical protein
MKQKMTTYARKLPVSLRLIKNLGIQKCNYRIVTTLGKSSSSYQRSSLVQCSSLYFSNALLHHNKNLFLSSNSLSVKCFSSKSQNKSIYALTQTATVVTREVRWFAKGAKELLKDTWAAIKITLRSDEAPPTDRLLVSRTVATWQSCGPLMFIYVLPVLGNLVFLLLWLKPVAIPSFLLSPMRRYRCTIIRDEEYKEGFQQLLVEPEERYELLPRQTLFNSLLYLNDNSLLNAVRTSNQLYNRLRVWQNVIASEDAAFREEGFSKRATAELINACDKRGLLNVLTSEDIKEYSLLSSNPELKPPQAEQFARLDEAIRNRLIAVLQKWIDSTATLEKSAQASCNIVKPYLLLANQINEKLTK